MTSDKLYKIGEVAAIIDVRPTVLRFWEKEFPQIKPSRTEKGQRAYTEYNLSLLKEIKRLLRERGMTIAGARKALAAKLSPEEEPRPEVDSRFLAEIETEIAEICRLLAMDEDL